MKPIKTARKLTLHRESLRQMTPRALPPAALARVVGGFAGPEDDGDPEAADVATWIRSICCCCMTSE
jgi:hypothetical protein